MAVQAALKETGGRERVLEYAYTPQSNTQLEFYEIDPKDNTTQRLIAAAKPGECATPRDDGEGRKLFCRLRAGKDSFPAPHKKSRNSQKRIK
jgi:hypothetical protein